MVMLPEGITDENRQSLEDLRFRILRVNEWAHRQEPRRLTAIYQNTPESDNPGTLPGDKPIVLDHSWREHPVGNDDLVGIYLGNNLVLVAEED